MLGSGRPSKEVTLWVSRKWHRKVRVGVSESPHRATAITLLGTHSSVDTGSSGVSTLSSQEGTWRPPKGW